MREKEAHTTLLFVRHGEPDYPETRIYSKKDDPGLTERGRRQAEALAKWAADQQGGRGIDAVYVSPTRRTLETAEPVLAGLGREATVEARLEERFFGAWEGMDFDAIRDGDPQGFTAWKTNPIGFAPKGGETIVDLSNRVDQLLDEIRQRHDKGVVLLVTHVGTIRAALCSAMKVPLEEYRRFHIYPGSVARVDYGRRQANLMYLGLMPGEESNWGGGTA